MENLIVYLFVLAPIIALFLFGVLINWIINNVKKIENNENII